mmetsp:Transcript_32008/g.82903  ORF Transcript_32008/g.82903 Transcript_32008/m.82903 type:complete len:347 (-) Transcript_32008:47-1087(-)
MAVLSPHASARTSSVPSTLMVPAMISEPLTLVTGRGSPVSAASLTVDIPLATTPSTGMRSPGLTATTSPGCSMSLGTSRVEPPSSMRRAIDGRMVCRDAMSDDAASLARSSSVLPSSTTPISIAGSSKKVGHPRAGSPAATQLMPNAATAPIPTSEFMSGAPSRNARKPSTRIWRPGPSSAAVARPACTGVEPSSFSQPGAPGKKWQMWCRKHVDASAPATIRRRVVSFSRCSRSARLAATTLLADELLPLPRSRTVVIKPTLLRMRHSVARSSSSASVMLRLPSGLSCTRTRAVSVARLTDALLTSGTSSSSRFTRPTQPPHFMPLMSSRITSSLPASWPLELAL